MGARPHPGGGFLQEQQETPKGAAISKGARRSVPPCLFTRHRGRGAGESTCPACSNCHLVVGDNIPPQGCYGGWPRAMIRRKHRDRDQAEMSNRRRQGKDIGMAELVGATLGGTSLCASATRSERPWVTLVEGVGCQTREGGGSPQLWVQRPVAEASQVA